LAALVVIGSFLKGGAIRDPLASAATNVGLVAFGDSITCGGRTSDYPSPEKGYAYLLGRDAGGSFTNWCINGGQAAEITRSIYSKANPESGRNPWFTVMMGTNDVEVYGPNKDQQQVFENSLAASVAWLALPRRSKVFAQDAEIHATGKWIGDNELHAGLGLQSSTPNSALAFTLKTSGAPIYFAYRVMDDDKASASVSVDGKQAAVLNAHGTNGARIRTMQGNPDSVALFRYAVAAGTHKIRIEVNTGGEGRNSFSFLWAGTPAPPALAEQPGVLVSGVLRQKWDTKKSLTERYDALVQKVVAEFSGDGLPVHYVPVRQRLDATTDMDDYLHPNDAGHQHLREAFASVMKQLT
jgi:lysophospholipase L1-like esterase